MLFYFFDLSRLSLVMPTMRHRQTVYCQSKLFYSNFIYFNLILSEISVASWGSLRIDFIIDGNKVL
jgi:hypothetical protein